MKRQRYTTEFKRKAVRLMIIDGMSASAVSARLEVKVNLLNPWKRQHLAALKATSDPQTDLSPSQLVAERDRLRKELAKTRRHNEIPREAQSWHARNA